MRRHLKVYFIRIFFVGCLLSGIAFYMTRNFQSDFSHNRYQKNSYTDVNVDNMAQKNENDLKKVIDKDVKVVLSNDKFTSFAEDHCPKFEEDMINVHFILHSHDDPGWLKTAQKYYDDDVKMILDNVYNELKKDANRKFVYSEMYFFDKWWSEIDNTKKEIVKGFVSNGQLEFVGGGWVQNDDACTHYTAMVDQLGYGLRKIKSIFGSKARPITGWQIDCFGYSKEQASIFAKSGFVAEVIHRIPNVEREHRREKRKMEFTWQGDEETEIRTHVLYDEYIPPHGLKFENAFNQEHDEVNKFNVDQKTKQLISTVKHRIKSYPTNHLLLIMGNDFTFKTSSIWFESIDLLVKYGNSLQERNNSKINFFYSTPSCYFKAVNNSKSQIQLPVKVGDFFPYATNPESYWTGYYSSRPQLKRLIRNTNTLLQTLEKFESFVSSDESRSMLKLIRENLFVTLHHDAITGTCKESVAENYMLMLNTALNQGQALASLIVSNLTSISTNFELCKLIEINSCSISQKETAFSATIFNGRSKSRLEYIRIPVTSTDFIESNEKLKIQFASIVDEEKQFPEYADRAKYEMIVPVKIPALGFATYRFAEQKGTGKEDAPFSKVIPDKNYIENEHYKIIFNVESGFMREIINKEEKISVDISQTFLWYESVRSGVYMMRPTKVNWINNAVSIKRREGAFFQEIRQTFSDETSQIIRLYKDKNYVEIEWTVGPVMAEHAKEVVTRFNANINNLNIFHTDANGRQIVERNTNQSTANNPTYPIAANYYPLTSMISIKDKNVQLTLIPDRPTGGSSAENGTVELLLHRKLYNDDGAGMGEFVVEVDDEKRPIVVRGKFWLTLTIPGIKTDNLWRELAKDMFYTPLVAFEKTSKGEKHVIKEWPMVDENKLNGVHLLSLQALDDNAYLLRLENYLSDTQRTISLKEILKENRLSDCHETFLTGDRNKFSSDKVEEIVELKPLEIKTFVCALNSMETS